MGIETFRASYDAQEIIKNPEIMKKFKGRKTQLFNTAIAEYGKHVLQPSDPTPEPPKRPKKVHIVRLPQ